MAGYHPISQGPGEVRGGASSPLINILLFFGGEFFFVFCFLQHPGLAFCNDNIFVISTFLFKSLAFDNLFI